MTWLLAVGFLVGYLLMSRHTWKQRALQFQMYWLEEALQHRENLQAAQEAFAQIQEEIDLKARDGSQDGATVFEVPWPESDPRLN